MTDVLNREQDLAAGEPSARVDNQSAYPPPALVEQEVLDRAGAAVRGANVISEKFLAASEHGPFHPTRLP
jgi:hypothetical protein